MVIDSCDGFFFRRLIIERFIPNLKLPKKLPNWNYLRNWPL